MAAVGTTPRDPRILVFSTNPISDPGIDLAGSAHLNYSPGVTVISVPCSSGVRPDWLVHAVEKGFDGVFVAADGGDCALVPDCTAKTAAAVERAQKTLSDHGLDPRRLKMGAICSVCAEPFVSHMKQFADTLRKL